GLSGGAGRVADRASASFVVECGQPDARVSVIPPQGQGLSGSREIPWIERHRNAMMLDEHPTHAFQLLRVTGNEDEAVPVRGQKARELQSDSTGSTRHECGSWHRRLPSGLRPPDEIPY